MLARPSALAAAFIVALGSVLAASPVLAQKSPNRPPQDVANDLVKQAIAKSQAGDHLAAIDLYLSAYSLVPQHTLLSNVGNEYQQAGKLVEALKYFCMYLEKDPTGTNATYATSKARSLQIELGNKDVDESDVCAPPRKEKPEPPPDEEITGGKGLAQPKPEEKESPPSPGRGLKLTGIALGVAGLAGVGLGTYYGLKAKEKSDFITDFDPNMEWPDDIRAIEEEGQKYENRQILLTIAGGAVAVTGIALFIVGSTRTSSTEKISVRPTATPGSVGLSIGGGF